MARLMFFTTVRYSIGLFVFLIAGLAVAAAVSKRNRALGAAAAAAAILAALYGHLLINSDYDFFGMALRSADTDRKIVALTFDDGPSAKYTTQILDILKENNAKATFFTLGKNAEAHPELIRRMVAEGHQIGNHTYSHYFLFTKSSAVRESEIMRTHRIIKDITGTDMTIFRAPYEYRDIRLMRLLGRLGYRFISHDIGTADGARATHEIIIARVMKKLHPGGIVAMHDARGDRTETVDALKVLLPLLKKEGYETVTIGRLTKYKSF